MVDELRLAARLRARPAARLRPRRLLPRALDAARGQGGRDGARSGTRRPRRCARSAMGMDLDLVLDEGGGAFYGPKISVQARDAIGRTWQMSTIQVDFQLPQRFDLHYVGADNERHRPIMIHRALFGSIERFFAILLEHYAGAFPAWLAPVQVAVLPVADRHDAYALRIADRLRGEGFRAEVVDAHCRLARRPHPPRQDREGPVRARRRRRRRRAGTVGVNRRGSDAPERGVAVDDVRRAPRRRGREPHVTLERLWAGWRADVHRHRSRRSRRTDGCLFCGLVHGARRTRPGSSTANDARLRGAERVPVHVGPPDGRARAPRGRARRAHRRRGDGADHHDAARDDGACASPTSPTASTSG